MRKLRIIDPGERKKKQKREKERKGEREEGYHHLWRDSGMADGAKLITPLVTSNLSDTLADR